ncbi:MAG: HEPN domain-containing protein [Bacteroidales bacterium]|jgi:HEPN domain-containing protein|nr:HEPN domain-containing protein [Bacteroidales bacterium]
MNKVEKIKNTDKVVSYWLTSSDDDYEVMNSLYESKKYAWTLFLGHIVIEKLLKAYYVKKHQEHAPFTHNLYRLAELSEIEMTEEYAEWFFKITTFNLNARYDDYKKEFNKMCTDSFTKEWIEKINTLRTWIKQML